MADQSSAFLNLYIYTNKIMNICTDNAVQEINKERGHFTGLRLGYSRWLTM